MDDDHLFLVAYDIADAKRWRRVFRIMNGYGEWLQLSVFQCRLSKMRHAELVALLEGIIKHSEDHVISMDLGLAEKANPKVVSLGKAFGIVQKGPVIV